MKKKSLAKKPKIEIVHISIVPHKEQRYDTVGDWFYKENDGYSRASLYINVSKLPNDPDNEKALAVAFHELCEVLICRSKGITQKQVDKFDMTWPSPSAAKRGVQNGEPGDDAQSPYHREHCFATAAERMLVAAMGIPWQSYEESIENVK